MSVSKTRKTEFTKSQGILRLNTKSMSDKTICKHFLEGNCKFGSECKYPHQSSNNNGNADRGHHHHHHRRENDDDGEANNTRQPHDYQSVQTQMEIISPGFNGIIDIHTLLTSGSPNTTNEALVSQLFRFPPKNWSNASTEKPEVLLALDFHGVTDLVSDPAEEIAPQGKFPICVVSYVGPFGDIRAKTRDNLKLRVEGGQIQMGVMVFKKLRDPGERGIPPIEFVASKRHAVELLLKYNSGLTSSGRVLFVDDSKDNVATVASLNDNRVKCAFLPKGTSSDRLKSFLKEQVQ